MLVVTQFLMILSTVSKVLTKDLAFISTTKRYSTTAIFRATSEGNLDFNDDIQQPSDSRNTPKRYHSRLAELYDQMFEDGSNSNHASVTSPKSMESSIFNSENNNMGKSSIGTNSDSSVASQSIQNNAHDLLSKRSSQQDSKSTPREFVKSERRAMKASSDFRRYQTFEYENDDIGDYMSHFQENYKDRKVLPEDSDFIASLNNLPSLESFSSSSFSPPSSPQIDKQRATTIPKMVKKPNEVLQAITQDTILPLEKRTLESVNSNNDESELSKTGGRTIKSILKAASTGEAEPYSSLTLHSQLSHIESEIASSNNNVQINLNSRKQVSMLLYGVPNESISIGALEAVAGGISNTEGKSKLASLILQHKRISKEIKRLENKKETFQSKNQNQANSNGSTVPDNIIVASNRDSREPLVLIDASAYIFRSYYAMPPMHRYDGEPVGATLGVCNLLNKLILSPLLKGEQPRVVMVFDSKDGTNFRKLLYPEYKANRQACPDDLKPQFDFVRDASDAYGILTLEAPGFEADDVIATIATKAMEEGTHVNILSGDKDLMQLVTMDDGGACIELIDPMKMIRYSHDRVIEQWGVEPNQLGDVLALAGDASDNIPGVPGIGPKIASSLIQQYGSLDNLLKNVDSIKQKARRESIQNNIDKAVLSRQLVQLERNIPSESIVFSSHFERVSDFRTEPLQIERLLKFYDRMGFKELKTRVKSRLPKMASIISNDGRYNDIFEKPSFEKKFKQKFTYRRPPSERDISDVPF